MGRRVVQVILQCPECGSIPEDGETMWEMCGGILCEACAEKNCEQEVEEVEYEVHGYGLLPEQ